MQTTWDDNHRLMRELWPSAEMTSALCKLFYDNLHKKNQCWVALALKNVRKTYSSKTPELKWILRAFYDHRDLQRESQASNKRHNSLTEQNLDEREVRMGRLKIREELHAFDEKDIEFGIRAVQQVVPIKTDGFDETKIDSWSDTQRGFVWAAIKRNQEEKALPF